MDLLSSRVRFRTASIFHVLQGQRDFVCLVPPGESGRESFVVSGVRPYISQS